MQKPTTVIPVIAIIIGMSLTFLCHFRLSRLRQELQQVEKPLGEFPISDPTRVHLRQIARPAPDSVAWRCFFPVRKTPLPKANQIAMVIVKGHQAGKQIQDPKGGWKRDDGTEFQIIASLRWQDDGTLHVGCGTGLWGFTVIRLDGQLSDFLKRHWDEISLEIAGEEETLLADPNQPVSFFRVRVPQRLVDKYVEEFGESNRATIKDIASFTLVRWPVVQADNASEEQ